MLIISRYFFSTMRTEEATTSDYSTTVRAMVFCLIQYRLGDS